MTHIRGWLTAVAVLAASVLGAWSVTGAPVGGTVSPAAVHATAADETPTQASHVGTRRESGVFSHNGSPITGRASAYKPLAAPNFGANVRANTDTQSPNLAQQEPSIAVNPTNPLNVVAAAKDERAGTDTKQIWIYTSTDGGATWTNQQFPLLSPASPYSSDPIVSFSDDGQCYVTALPYGGGTNDGVQVARSLDGGLTFSTVEHLPGSSGNSDKEWTWVDNFPYSPYYHRIYVAWMDFGRNSSIIRLNYSTDRGATWSPVVTVGVANQFPMPVTLPNGNLIVTYYAGSAVAYRRSIDGGLSFSAFQSISTLTPPPCPPDNSGCSIWRLSPIPVNSVNPVDGAQVVVWADGRTESNARIYYSRSTDGGVSFSPAAQLAPPGVPNTYQVEPWVVADEQGTFHAIWYDDRENANTSIFNIYYSQSTDDGATWTPAVRISTATSDLRIGIPGSYNQAAGDYINMAVSHGNVYGVWTDTRAGNGEDVYVVRGVFTGGPATPFATATALPSNTAAAGGTATPSPCLIQFQDVDAANTFYPFVRCLACRNILGGYKCGGSGEPCGTSGDPYFRPSADISRGQIAKIVTQAAGLSDDTGTQIYEDVPPGSPFFVFIQRLSNKGYMGGYPCGQLPTETCIGPPATARPYFRPSTSASRGQLSKIVSNAAGFTEDVIGQYYTDVPQDNPFYPYVQRLTAAGVMSGYMCSDPDEPCDDQSRPYFRPNANVTRGQASKIVSNTFFPNCQTPARSR